MDGKHGAASKLAARSVGSGRVPALGGSGGKTAAVLGGGLSGLSAARSLLERGFDVSLVEKRPFLGGRAYSFYSREADTDVDNGQHVFMGCCTYYVDFIEALGAYGDAALQDSLRAEVVRDGKRGVLMSAPALGPLHLMPSFVRYPHLGVVDKIRAAYGLLRAALTDRRRHAGALDGESFYSWLKRHHQSDGAIEGLWNLIILPTLNDTVHSVNADMALMVIQEGFLKQPRAAAIGYARVGLSSLAGIPGQRFIKDRGGAVILGRAVRAILVGDGGVSAVRLSDGSTLEADAYVSALPFGALLDCLPPERAREPFFAAAAGLTSAPIVGIHLWYDRQIMEESFAAFLGSPVQWVFNRSRIQGEAGASGQYVCISLSGAWEFIDRPKDELRKLFTEEMRRLFPLARRAEVRKCLVIKQPDATFRCVPGVASHRLSQATPIPNLFLAGEWTDTGWPSTMEGAVRSGVYAAEALAASF